MSIRKDTRIHLVEELEKIEPRTPAIQFIIDEAKAGEYHDYKNRKYVCGKIVASTHLRQAGLRDLAVRLEQGEFDEVPDAEDDETLAQDLRELLGGDRVRVGEEAMEERKGQDASE